MTDHDDARAQLSGMTEITERTLDDALYHHRSQLDTLYRDCPTAFWLAPDADDLLLAPGDPAPIAPVRAPGPAPDVDEEPRAHGLGRAIGYGIVSAGPIFTATAMMLDRTGYDSSWWDAVARGLVSLFAFPLTITVGAFLAFLPVFFGVLGLTAIGRTHEAARVPAVWAATGGAMGAALATVFDAGATAGLALVATSILSARIAHVAIRWSDLETA